MFINICLKNLRQIFYYRTLQVSGVSAASKLGSEAWCSDSLGQELAMDSPLLSSTFPTILL